VSSISFASTTAWCFFASGLRNGFTRIAITFVFNLSYSGQKQKMHIAYTSLP
jgi:hypothetical protein